MARGWESKSIESQMDDAGRDHSGQARTPISDDDRKLQVRHNHLLLNRTRILHEMQTACNARFRTQLERELMFLDQELEKHKT